MALQWGNEVSEVGSGNVTDTVTLMCWHACIGVEICYFFLLLVSLPFSSSYYYYN